MSDSPIVFIDDDADDQFLFRKSLAALRVANPIITFHDGHTALDYLETTQQVPFLIISELVLPGLSGLELRYQIEQDPILRKKSIPFIFLTSPVPNYLVEQAYELTIQGLFEKRSTVQGWQEQLQSILAYWLDCRHPKPSAV